jgi:hypothetical protein
MPILGFNYHNSLIVHRIRSPLDAGALNESHAKTT